MFRAAALGISLALSLSACSSKPMHVEGTIGSVDVMGHRCWYVTTRQLKHFEIYSEDPTLLRDGKQVAMDCKLSTKETVCKIGQLLEVLSYEVVDAEPPAIKIP